MLQGKAKEEFFKWINSLNCVDNPNPDVCNFEVENFINLSQTCQNALIIEWFDSFGIYIEVGGANYRGVEFWYNIQELKTINGHNGEYFNTRSEATTKAIEKAVEIFNQLNK